MFAILQPKSYWKGIAAIKKLAEAAKVSEDIARSWLKKQTLWQIYLPLRAIFYVLYLMNIARTLSTRLTFYTCLTTTLAVRHISTL